MEKSEVSFAGWLNAFSSADIDQEGRNTQREALQKMEELATTLTDWSKVYESATGAEFASEYRHLCVTSKSIAQKALDKIQELKSQATEEEIRDVRDECRGEILETLRHTLNDELRSRKKTQ